MQWKMSLAIDGKRDFIHRQKRKRSRYSNRSGLKIVWITSLWTLRRWTAAGRNCPFNYCSTRTSFGRWTHRWPGFIGSAGDLWFNAWPNKQMGITFVVATHNLLLTEKADRVFDYSRRVYSPRNPCQSSLIFSVLWLRIFLVMDGEPSSPSSIYWFSSVVFLRWWLLLRQRISLGITDRSICSPDRVTQCIWPLWKSCDWWWFSPAQELIPQYVKSATPLVLGLLWWMTASCSLGLQIWRICRLCILCSWFKETGHQRIKRSP